MANNTPSWASPETSGQIRRSQYLSDALRQMQGSRTADSYRTGTATIANTLADAILGFASRDADKKANEALSADKTSLADMIRGQFPDQQGIAAQQLGQDKAFDLTPAGNEQRQQVGGIGNLAEMIFKTTGDPAAALNAGLQQQQQMKADQRYEQERKDKLSQPIIANAGDRGFVRNPDGTFGEAFNVPAAPGSTPGARVQSTFIDKDGQLNVVMGDGAVVPKGIIARDSLFNVDVGGVPFVGSRYQGGLQPVATPQQVGQNKAGIQNVTAKGEAQTQAQIDLPQTIANAEQSLGVIDQLLAHPKASSRYGMRGVLPPLPGEEAGAQAYIDQIGGNAFLQAYNSLKGGGQITEVEGAKATQAITRLTNQWQDWDSAKKAAQELRQIIENGVLRAKAKAGQLDFSQLTDAQIDALAQSTN